MISSLAAMRAGTPSTTLFRYTIGVLPARKPACTAVSSQLCPARTSGRALIMVGRPGSYSMGVKGAAELSARTYELRDIVGNVKLGRRSNLCDRLAAQDSRPGLPACPLPLHKAGRREDMNWKLTLP